MSVKLKVEDLVASSFTGHATSDETARWVGELDDQFTGKLVSVGLIAPSEESSVTTLGAFIRSYVQQRADVKPSTALVYGHTERNLVEYFGSNKPITEITARGAGIARWGVS